MKVKAAFAQPESLLIGVLRLVGTMSLLALVFVFVPYGWMNAIYGLLGWGVLPSEPIVGYLARSTSVFYALLGALKWLASMDVRRYRNLIVLIGGFMVFFGLVFFVVDYWEGLGLFWALIEAAANGFFGVLMLWLVRKVAKG